MYENRLYSSAVLSMTVCSRKFSVQNHGVRLILIYLLLPGCCISKFEARLVCGSTLQNTLRVRIRSTPSSISFQ